MRLSRFSFFFLLVYDFHETDTSDVVLKLLLRIAEQIEPAL